MTRRDWLVWLVAVVVGSIVLRLVLESTEAAVAVLAVLAVIAAARVWMRRRANRSSNSSM